VAAIVSKIKLLSRDLAMNYALRATGRESARFKTAWLALISAVAAESRQAPVN